jgi:hypothetical protein
LKSAGIFVNGYFNLDGSSSPQICKLWGESTLPFPDSKATHVKNCFAASFSLLSVFHSGKYFRLRVRLAALDGVFPYKTTYKVLTFVILAGVPYRIVIKTFKACSL